jgi:hypothetical protein
VHVLARHLRWHEQLDWPRFSTRVVAEFRRPVDLGLVVTNAPARQPGEVEPQLGPLRVHLAEPTRQRSFLQSSVVWLPSHLRSEHEVNISDSAVVLDLPIETSFARTVAALRASIDIASNLEHVFRDLPPSARLQDNLAAWRARARSLDMRPTDTPLGFTGTLAGYECAAYIAPNHAEYRTIATLRLRDPYDGLLTVRPEAEADPIGCYQGWSGIPGLHLGCGLAARSMFPRLASALIGPEVRYAIEHATLIGKLCIDQDRATLSTDGARVDWVNAALAELSSLAGLFPGRRPVSTAGQ